MVQISKIKYFMLQIWIWTRCQKGSVYGEVTEPNPNTRFGWFLLKKIFVNRTFVFQKFQNSSTFWYKISRIKVFLVWNFKIQVIFGAKFKKSRVFGAKFLKSSIFAANFDLNLARERFGVRWGNRTEHVRPNRTKSKERSVVL